MALSEQRVLISIEVLPEQNAINVKWEDQISRDGAMISGLPFRRAYGKDQRAEFISDLSLYINESSAVVYADSAGMNA